MSYADIARNLSSSLNAAASFTDPDLSDQGIQKKRAELRETAVAKARAEYNQLAANATTYRDSARAQVDRLHNLMDRGTAADREVTFRRVAMLLDAGRGLADVIAEATPAELHAIEEWGPTWARAQATKPGGIDKLHFAEPDTGWIADAVMARRAEGGNPAYANLQEAEEALQQSKGWGAYIDALEAGESPLGSVLNTIYQTDEAGYRAAFRADMTEPGADVPAAGGESGAADGVGTDA